MRVATSQMFSRPTSLMTSLTAKADAIQTSIATTTKFTAPSSDPAAFLRLDSLKRGKADDLSSAANVKLAQGVLAQSDSTLGAIETQLQRVQELTIQASTGTLNDENRAAIANEESRSAIEDTDIPSAVAELQKTLTVLQATQASFTKLSGMSLFDYLR